MLAVLVSQGSLCLAQTAVYYSVGTSAADLKTGSPTVTISSGTATFSVAQPDNVGVGDEVTYNGSTQAYISGRTSATTYSVITATGGTPPNVAGQTVDSITRAFGSLTAAEANSSDASHLNTSDLVAGNIQLNWTCYNDGPLNDSGIVIDGWTTGPSNYIRVFAPADAGEVGASQRHTGTAGSGFRVVPSLSPPATFSVIEVFEDYVRLEGIEIDGTNIVSARHVNAVRVASPVTATSDLRFDGLVIHDIANSSINQATNDGDVHAILLQQGSNKISNTIIYDLDENNNNAGSIVVPIYFSPLVTGTNFVHNVTIYDVKNNVSPDAARGVRRNSPGTVEATNVAVFDVLSTLGAESCFEGAITQSNNVSSDATAAGPGSQINEIAYASYFVSTTAGAEDLHLLNDSNTLWGSFGADLDSNANLPVTRDVDRETRDRATPDIGADEFPVIALFRSVGTTATDLNTSARTIAISGTTATFSGAMPTNVGVGDVLQYQVAATFYVAFIHRRTSSTVYTVATSAGGAPQAAVAGTAVGVYRAYTSLFNWEAQDENNTLDDTVENFDTTTNLVTNKTTMNVAAYGAGADTTAVVVNGWTTGADHYIRIYTPTSTSEVGTSQRHGGVWDTSKHRLEAPTEVLRISEEYVRVDGLQVRLTADTVNVGGIVFTGASGVSYYEVSNSIVRGNGVGVQDIRLGVNLFAAGSGVIQIWNNIIYDWAGGTNAVDGIGPDDPDFTFNISNNTVVDCRVGIEQWDGTVVVKNNIAYNNGLNYSGTFVGGSTNNLSGPAQGGAPGASPRNFAPVTFVNAAADDFHLQPSDTGAQDFGANLSADPNLAFAYDIDLASRVVPWDIGADDVLGTTAVELTSFTATGNDSDVLLEWETGSELDNLGFQLYRSSSEEGPYERITTRLIPGLGSSPAGARYRYRDAAVENGRSYYYELEDIETTGKTERHGPVLGVPRAGVFAGDASEDGAGSLITYGAPLRNSLRVLTESRFEMVVELRTEGFYIKPLDDGTVELRVPDFEEVGAAGSPGVPVARRWIDAIAGRTVRIGSVRVDDVETFSGWTLSSRGMPELEADHRGTVRATARRGRTAKASVDGYPREAARIVEVGFQQDIKKALLELAPLRWDASTGRLHLARQLQVRVLFTGRDPKEKSVNGARGRRERALPGGRPSRALARLVTREPGLYQVRYEDIFGRRRARGEAVRLSRRGDAVAYHLEPDRGRFGPGTVLFFIAGGSRDNPYGNEAIYELELAEGVQMAAADAAPQGPPAPVAWHRLQREENHLYQAALVDAPDLWLWDTITAETIRDYPFQLRGLFPSSEASRLRVWIQGTSDLPPSPDHHMRLCVNGSPLGEAWLDGKESRRIEVEVPPGLLREGDNLLQVENVGDTEAAYSMVMMDHFEVVYPRRTTLDEDGAFEAWWSQEGVAEISGGRVVIDVTDERPRWLTGALVGDDGMLRFRVESGRRYLAVSAAGIRRPSVRTVPRTTLREPHQRADYLIIGPRDFLQAARPLASHRASQGLSVRTVPVEDIYSEFGFGEPGPDAVLAFVAHAYHRWESPSPRYVLLLGDATYDPKDFLGTGAGNDVPSPAVRTTYLWTASDLAYSLVNGEDGLPDIAIGRLPASSVEEVRSAVSKILRYEGSRRGLAEKIVLIADDSDEGGDFVANAEELSRTVFSASGAETIYLSHLGTDATRRAVIEAFDQGSTLTSYIGHGGIDLWASERILSSADVSALSPQERQPLLLTLNCLNGYFHFPYFDSLSEELLKPQDRGVIAAISPSGLSLDGPAHKLHRALLEELLNGAHPRLGDAFLAAQESYAATGAFPELLKIYHLLGDPALMLR